MVQLDAAGHRAGPSRRNSDPDRAGVWSWNVRATPNPCPLLSQDPRSGTICQHPIHTLPTCTLVPYTSTRSSRTLRRHTLRPQTPAPHLHTPTLQLHTRCPLASLQSHVHVRVRVGRATCVLSLVPACAVLSSRECIGTPPQTCSWHVSCSMCTYKCM